MQGPLQIRFHGLDSSPLLSTMIEDRVASLEHVYQHITDCNVTIEQGHHRHRKGNTLRVTIELRVPGSEIVVSRENAKDLAHDDPLIVLRDAFDAARRKLQDYSRRMRGDVKTHENSYQDGKVARVFPLDGYGFIESVDHREIYFHENSVITGEFEDLKEGSRVRFVEELGEQRPQASTVHAIKI